MKKKSTTFGLEPEQLASLLGIGSETRRLYRKSNPDQKKAEMLRRRLRGTLPLDKSQVEMLPAVLSHLCHTIGLLAGETNMDLLLNPDTDIYLIKRVKDYYKKLSRHAESEVEYETAKAVYFAAIASALVFHKLRITKFSYKNLKSLFASLLKKKWIPRDLAVLFNDARKYCKKKSTKL